VLFGVQAFYVRGKNEFRDDRSFDGLGKSLALRFPNLVKKLKNRRSRCKPLRGGCGTGEAIVRKPKPIMLARFDVTNSA
jgi:hypothetical protein